MGNRTALSRITMLVVAAIAMVAGKSVAQVSPGAHSPAEVALDKILRIAERDQDILDNILHRYPVAKAKQIDYRTWLSAKLIAGIQAEQKRLLDKDCGGKYREGDICGIDYNPLTCAQDTVPAHSYKTVRESADMAVVKRAGDRYRMIRTGTSWQLDGVKCGSGEIRFNFP